MEKGIGICILIGLTLYSTAFIIKSGCFSKTQQIVLCILILFPPLQWILAIILFQYNRKNTELKGFANSRINEKVESLKVALEKGLISEAEYTKKIEEVSQRIKSQKVKESNEYKTLLKLKKQGLLNGKEFEDKLRHLESIEDNKHP